MELTSQQKAALIRAHHGGFADSDEAACLAVWHSLPAATRQAYQAAAAAAPQEPTREGLIDDGRLTMDDVDN